MRARVNPQTDSLMGMLELIQDPDKYGKQISELKALHAQIKADLGVLATKKEADALRSEALNKRNEADRYATSVRREVEDSRREVEDLKTKVRAELDKAKLDFVKAADFRQDYEDKLVRLAKDKAQYEKHLKGEFERLAQEKKSLEKDRLELSDTRKRWDGALGKARELLKI